MSEIPPILVTFDGAVWRPKDPRTLARALKYFEPGATYRVEFKDERSADSHNATMAGIARAWDNLPEGIEKQHPTINKQTPKHFRRWLLIQNGFATETKLVFDTDDDAVRAATRERARDSYAVILVRRNVVTIFEAESMAAKAMTKERFETAKQLILQQAADMVGMTVAELTSRPEAVDHHHPNAPDLSEPEIPRADPAPPAEEKPAPAPSRSPPAGTPSAVVPKTPDQYLYHLKGWLEFTTDRRRIDDRYTHEQDSIWPNLNPKLTAEQRMFCDSMVNDRLQLLPGNR